MTTANEVGAEPEVVHDLVISYGDCEFWARCSCGHALGSIRPNQSLNEFGTPWERHVMGVPS